VRHFDGLCPRASQRYLGITQAGEPPFEFRSDDTLIFQDEYL
jgi:hypothetical protein